MSVQEPLTSSAATIKALQFLNEFGHEWPGLSEPPTSLRGETFIAYHCHNRTIDYPLILYFWANAPTIMTVISTVRNLFCFITTLKLLKARRALMNST